MEKRDTLQLSCMHPHDQAALISWRLVGFGEFQASRDAAFCIGGIQGLAKAWLRAAVVWCRSGGGLWGRPCGHVRVQHCPSIPVCSADKPHITLVSMSTFHVLFRLI